MRNPIKTITDKVKKVNKEKNSHLNKWIERFNRSLYFYENVLNKMDGYQSLYDGSKKIEANPNKKQAVTKQATNVQNIVYELIESQIDSNIPLPKVETRSKQNEGKAALIEEMLKAQMNRLPMEVLNDQDERTCPIQGGSWYLVEWDNTIKSHSTTGDIAVTLLHPKQVIPQAGVVDWRNGEYIFVRLTQTKEYIKRRYGVDVGEESEEFPQIERVEGEGAYDLVTQVVCYFKNTEGGIGLITWVKEKLLDYMEDYQARELLNGDNSLPDADNCDEEVLNQDIIESFEVPKDEVTGVEVTRPTIKIPCKTRLPYYKPNVFPLVLRKNVSEFGKVLGTSDVEKIADQQNVIKKLDTKIEEKIFNGGSYVTLPKGVHFETTDNDYKIVRLENPAQKQMIDVININADISYDIQLKQINYQVAKDTLGITDSYQGKPDSTAQSGIAKEIAARQSSGRLESKRRMKDYAYQELYEIMFKFMLAYADEPRPFKTDEKGVYKEFNRYDFLELDDAKEWFYNDEYFFSTDTAGSLGSDRIYMWEQCRLNLSSGVYGNPQDIKTILRFWKTMESLHYPTAKVIRAEIEEELKKQEEIMMQQVMQQGANDMGRINEIPIPQNDMDINKIQGNDIDYIGNDIITSTKMQKLPQELLIQLQREQEELK